jgi:retron-type reverse transcriptase
MNELNQTTYEWQNIPWRKLERSVYKLQKRIYRASSRGDILTVHKLQRLMLKSWSAKCLAVRKVTQDNQGKKTAGKAGIMDNGELESSQAGVPQGGTLSPLLANIALHAMENLVKDFAEGLKLFYPNGSPERKDTQICPALLKTDRYSYLI